MRKLIVAVMSIGVSGVALYSATSVALAQTAPPRVSSAYLAETLKRAQAAIEKKDYAVALSELDIADATPNKIATAVVVIAAVGIWTVAVAAIRIAQAVTQAQA